MQVVQTDAAKFCALCTTLLASMEKVESWEYTTISGRQMRQVTVRWPGLTLSFQLPETAVSDQQKLVTLKADCDTSLVGVRLLEALGRCGVRAPFVGEVVPRTNADGLSLLALDALPQQLLLGLLMLPPEVLLPGQSPRQRTSVEMKVLLRRRQRVAA